MSISNDTKIKIMHMHIRYILRERGMSQLELANKSGLTAAAVSRYCSGARTPNLESLLAICEALDVSPNDMLGWREQ